MLDDAFAAPLTQFPAPYDPQVNAVLPTSGANQKTVSMWSALKGRIFSKTGLTTPQKTGPKAPTVKDGIWAAAKPHQLAPALPQQLGSGGVLGDGDSLPTSYASNDWQRKALFSPPPPTAVQFPQAAYNSFDQLENWPDNQAALDAFAGQTVAAVVMKN